MTTREAQNKAIVRRFFEAFGANDQADLNEVLAPELVVYSHSPDPQNREAYLQEIGRWHAAFGETLFTIEEQIAEADKVVSRATLRAIHSRGDFLGLPPAGKQIVVSGITIERIQDDKIVEHRVESDWWGMMQQLGLVPAPKPVR
jgi:predicted ester cyclase